MDYINELLELVAEKEAYFREYDEATQRMLSCPADDMEIEVAKRQQLIAKIDGVDAGIAEKAAAMGEQGEQAMAALKLKCDRSDLEELFWPLFDRAQSLFGIIDRIQRTEPQIVDRIEAELDALTEQIKANNRSMGAKVAKYQTFQTSDPGPRILNKV